MNPNDSGNRTGETPLQSWKEIGAYLQRNEVTVRRWEKQEGLPVHRHAHKVRGSVYAYPSELDAWRTSRSVAAESPRPRPLWKIPAFSATILLCLMMVGNSIRPVSAQDPGQSARQVWTTEPAIDPNESIPSPDGRYIGFTDWSTGNLGVHDLLTGTSRLLTHEGFDKGFVDEDIIMSPDGSRIAYTWDDAKVGYQLRIVSTAGGPAQVIRNDEYIKPKGWSLDDKLLVIRWLTDQTTQIAMVSLADKSLHPIKSLSWQHGVEARLSPDGHYVAYSVPVSENSDARDVFLLASDGSQETPVVQNPANDFGPVWSPDGSQLLFLSDRTGSNSLWSIAVEHGKPKGEAVLVKRDLGQVQPLGMRRDGTFYYFAPGNTETNVYSVELGPDGKASKPPVLAVDRFIGSNTGSSLSDDGKRIAYYQNRPGRGWGIAIRNLDTGGDREVPSKAAYGATAGWGYGPMWFPGGRSLLAISRVAGQRGLLMMRVDTETGNVKPLHHVSGTQGQALSPDGRSIYYTEVLTSEPAITGRLVRFDIDTGKERELKSGEHLVAVAVSPDGKQLAYVVGNPGKYIGVIPASGGEAHEVYRTRSGIDSYNTLAWTPDQNWLVFGTRNNANTLTTLWRVPVAGGQPEHVGVNMPGTIKGPQFDPSGRHLFYSSSQAGKGEVWALENFLPAARRE